MIPASSLTRSFGRVFDTEHYAALAPGTCCRSGRRSPAGSASGSGRPVIGSGSVAGGPPRLTGGLHLHRGGSLDPGRLLGQPLIDREPLRQLLIRRPAGPPRSGAGSFARMPSPRPPSACRWPRGSSARWRSPRRPAARPGGGAPRPREPGILTLGIPLTLQQSPLVCVSVLQATRVARPDLGLPRWQPLTDRRVGSRLGSPLLDVGPHPARLCRRWASFRRASSSSMACCRASCCAAQPRWQPVALGVVGLDLEQLGPQEVPSFVAGLRHPPGS